MQSNNQANKKTDKIYKCKNHLVKIRILDKAKNLDPIVFEISASICDKNGKALKRDGGYYIRPAERHTFNLTGDINIKKEMDKKIKDCVKNSVSWYKGLTSAENFYNGWKNETK